MSQRIVVDVGNSRVKMGLCLPEGVGDAVGMSNRSDEWDLCASRWSVNDKSEFVIAGVVPATVAAFRAWVTSRGCRCRVIESYREIPLQVDVEQPQRVGIDRLLSAFAAKCLFPLQRSLVVDAGTAITINLVDESGIFRGGAILPGFYLMAHALHERTAQLPLVPVTGQGELPFVPVKGQAEFPGRNTYAAIRAGITSAAVGAIELTASRAGAKRLLFTGGDGSTLESLVTFASKHYDATLVLEGIRRVVEASP